jgi:hypothetical protein
MPFTDNRPAIKEILVLLDNGRYVHVDPKEGHLIAWTDVGVEIIEAWYADEKNQRLENMGIARKAWNPEPAPSVTLAMAAPTSAPAFRTTPFA